MLASLPLAALRIDPAVAAALEHVGIVTIGQLMQIPRSVLPPRFGHDLLLRLDQALGQAHEALVPLQHHRPIVAVREFDSAVDSLEAIWLILKQLIERVIADLARRGCGARELKAAFKPMYGPAVEKRIHLSRPSRDASNLFNLLRCALETMRTDDGFVRFELAVPVFERVSEEQISLTRQEREQQSAAAELGQLIERLCARLGGEAVEQAQPVESYIPEYAYADIAASVISSGMGASPMRPPPRRLAHGRGAHATDPCRAAVPACWDDTPPPVRPLHLLRRPVEIGVMVSPSEDREGYPISFTHGGQVHPLRFAVGPERIAGQWWDGHDKTRDYFDVEDPAGRRFWIFRVLETWKWYLHGEFE